ncbi:hypothetical protein ACFYWN_36520 [Streptomyces sp. NPDC002917]|uniref:hypothetical protein n=1 Tax=unclassified Streptomyces TaxID=2593676 RepID=UPI002E812EF2|nr:hypothetical protein [Streptomyces sp. NBC_00562]WTC80980.1 hypothetical protein OH719_25870 [Streptomyces sp. NBC_01653]WTD34428.1 hypothetical protein OHB03_20560 [Streptomyces sp. NBC_01643]WTD89886.1 hypothetical protein OG891_21000 [Streptomyces sp. NBC_01637]WUC20884.1 hypothetical protein OHA33_19535 [Streptomyces sp. NBC_00562]
MSVVSSVLVPYASYLRVYEPLAAFPEPERTHWARYAGRARIPTAQDELRRSLADLVATPPVGVPVHESGDAFVAEVNGVVCVCPWRTRLRGWLALGELAEMFPAPVLDAVLPPVVRGQAVADHERWAERNPDARPWIRTAVWQVPVRWFVLFADEEREHAGAAADGGAPVLRYRTPMVQARRRLARALKTLRESVDEGPLTEGLVDVGRWLEEFHPRALVELDYGGLVHALSAKQLAEDRSALDVAEGIAALRAGDTEGAGEAYGRLAERWRAVRDRQFAN